MKPYYLYIIESDNGRHYIGITENIEKRLESHNLGLSKWTKRYKDWKLLYREKVKNITEARKGKNYFKKLKGGNQFYKIIGQIKNGA
jgi:putative endonuclease